MGIPNFQDVIVLNSDTLSMGIEQLVIGSDAGSKSIVFAQDPALASAMHLVASNPTGQRTQVLQDGSGTIGYLTNISAGTTVITNGSVVFSNSGFVFGANGNTISMGVRTLSNLEVGSNILTVATTQSSQFSTSTPPLTGGVGFANGIRVEAPCPINVTYIDPKGQQTLTMRASVNGSGTVSASLTISGWIAIYTINGSTAGMLSSGVATQTLTVSASSNNSQGTSIAFDNRVTNTTWSVTPGDYMIFTGCSFSLSCSASTSGGGASVLATVRIDRTIAGFANNAVSYTIPYWDNGLLNSSATSFHLSQLVNNLGENIQQVYEYVRLIGS